MTKLQRWVLISLCAFLLISAAVVVLYISKKTLTTQENVLFNLLLTFFSVGVSLVISHLYYESAKAHSIEEIKKDYQDNLKNYAEKAAEKVDNLSNELTKLSLYLQDDDPHEYSLEEALLVNEERTRSTIHILNTLKSVNDRSLSDWKGIIPEDEINERTESRAEQVEALNELYENFKEIREPKTDFYFDVGNASSDVSNRVAELSQKIEEITSTIVGTRPPVKKKQPAREDVVSNCPVCQAEVTYRQRPKSNSHIGVNCKACGTKLRSDWSDDDGFVLSTKPMPNVAPAKQLDESIIASVKELLPPQPWPQGTSQNISKELGLSHNVVNKAIDQLVERGDFQVQINGVLYKPIKAVQKKNLSTSSSKPKSVKPKASNVKAADSEAPPTTN